MKVSLQFGAMVARISEQLDDLGLTANSHLMAHWQRDAEAITRLSVRGMLSEAETSKARRRLLKEILSATSTRSKA